MHPFDGENKDWKGISKLVTNIAKELDNQNDQGWFFDVGANVGQYTWEVRKVCPNRNILAFEPDPENIKLLEKPSLRPIYKI